MLDRDMLNRFKRKDEIRSFSFVRVGSIQIVGKEVHTPVPVPVARK